MSITTETPVADILPDWKYTHIAFISNKLLETGGYATPQQIADPVLLSSKENSLQKIQALLTHAHETLKEDLNTGRPEPVYLTEVDFPAGVVGKILIAINSMSSFTLMLPQEY